MISFQDVKEIYNAYREFERKRLVQFLSGKGLKVSQLGGMGLCNYTNRNTLKRSYDLTNWKWVDVTIGEKKFFISLQAFDQDSNSKNYHVLMDRIGICKYDKEIRKPNYFKIMKMTSLELPLNDESLEELYQLLIDDNKYSCL